MKVSEMIKNLQKFMAENGDLECWYAVDDEGNGYSPIYFEPTMYYTNGDGDVRQTLEDFDMDDYVEDVQQICVVN
jgi:hypothetical protein